MGKRRKKGLAGLGHHGGEFGDHVDAAFRAAEDGDCSRVEQQLRYAAEDAGADDGEGDPLTDLRLLKKLKPQLLEQCRTGALHGGGGAIPVEEMHFEPNDPDRPFRWYTYVLLYGGGLIVAIIAAKKWAKSASTASASAQPTPIVEV